MDSSCDVCGADDTCEPWLEVCLVGILARWIHRCRSCDFHQVRPRLTTPEIVSLYPADYFDGASAVGYRDYARQAQRQKREAYFLARRFRRHASPVPGDSPRVLEVGCALGFLLGPLRDLGFHVSGVDASAFAAYYASSRLGIAIRHGTLEEAAYPNDAFDVVLQKDLLEHVANPRAHLVETARVMKPGARLWVVTPHGQANLRPLAAVATGASGDDLPLLDQGHLSFFTASNLRRLFDECGFAIEDAGLIGVRRGLRALGWLPGQKRFAGTTRRPACTEPLRKPPGHSPREAFETLARVVDEAVSQRQRWVDGRKPYSHVHRFFKSLDRLPVSTGLGYDFEFWLRKR